MATIAIINQFFVMNSILNLQFLELNYSIIPDISTTKTYGQVFADSTYANKNKQTNNIHPFKLF
jgi:hypothetical protein